MASHLQSPGFDSCLVEFACLCDVWCVLPVLARFTPGSVVSSRGRADKSGLVAVSELPCTSARTSSSLG